NIPDKAFPAQLAAMHRSSDAYAYLSAAQQGERALEVWDVIDDPEAVAEMPRSMLMGRIAAHLQAAAEPDRALAMITLAINTGEAQGPALARHLMLRARCLDSNAMLGS